MNDDTDIERAAREIVETWMLMGDSTPEHHAMREHDKKVIWAIWPELAGLLEDLIWKFINVKDLSQESQNTEDVSGQRQETPESQ